MSPIPGALPPSQPSLLVLPPRLSPAARQETAIPCGGGLLIGVDGGATKTVAAAYDLASGAISIGTAGPGNPESVGFRSAIDAVAAAIAKALPQPRARVMAAVLAIAGINEPPGGQHLLSALPMVPAESSVAVNDVVGALAVHWRRPPSSPSLGRAAIPSGSARPVIPGGAGAEAICSVMRALATGSAWPRSGPRSPTVTGGEP
jgi:hypothetical protein